MLFYIKVFKLWDIRRQVKLTQELYFLFWRRDECIFGSIQGNFMLQRILIFYCLYLRINCMCAKLTRGRLTTSDNFHTCMLWWLVFGQPDLLMDAQRAGKTFLGVSERLFLEEVSIWIVELSEEGGLPMQVHLIQSTEDLTRTEGWVALCLSWDFHLLLPWDIRCQHSWFSSWHFFPWTFGLGLCFAQLAPQLLRASNSELLLGSPGSTAHTWQMARLLGLHNHVSQLLYKSHLIFMCCSCSVAQSCPTLCDPMDCSTPGCPVLHHLPELAQTHVHQVSDAIQPTHPLLSPSSPAPNPSQH